MLCTCCKLHLLVACVPPFCLDHGSVCTGVNEGAQEFKGVFSKRLGVRKEQGHFQGKVRMCLEGTGLGFKGCGSNRLFVLTTPKVGSMCTRVNEGAQEFKGVFQRRL